MARERERERERAMNRAHLLCGVIVMDGMDPLRDSHGWMAWHGMGPLRDSHGWDWVHSQSLNDHLYVHTYIITYIYIIHDDV